MTIQYAALAFLIGLFSAWYSRTVGLGGSLVLRPLIRMILEVPGKVALGTPAALNILAAGSGSYTYWKKHLIYTKVAAITGICGGITAVIGASRTTFFSGKQMMFIISAFIFVMGIALIFREEKIEQEEKIMHHDVRKELLHPVKKSVFIGLLVGIAAGFLGLGGGFLMVPLFMFLFEIESHHAVATSLLAVLIMSVPSALTHLYLGNIDLALFLACGLGCIFGGQIGSRTVVKVKSKTLRWIVIISYFIASIALAAFELMSTGLA